MNGKSFYARWSVVILLLTAAVAPGVGGGALRALRTNRNEVKEWLPSKYQETTDFNWFLKHFHGGQFVLVSWDGCTLDDSRLELFSRKLVTPPGEKWPEGRPRYFTRCVTGTDVLAELMNAPTNLPREEAVARLHQALIGPDHRQTCAVLTFTEEGEKNPRKTLEYIQHVAEKECAIPAATIRMGGPPVDNVELDKAGETSLMRLAVVTGVLGVAITWWCLRSAKLMVMVFFSGVFSAGASLAVVWYAGGQMNSILLTMPSLVYVAAISGAIHLANYYRDTAHAEGLAGAPGRAVRHAWVPLTLACLTTAFGLLSLSISDLVPIQMFGIYSAIGVVLATAVLFFYLPAALEKFPVPPQEDAQGGGAIHRLTEYIFSSRWKPLGYGILRYNLLAAAACLAVLVACGWGIGRIETSVKLLNFFQPSSNIVQGYTWLEQKLGPLIPMEVVLRFDKQNCPLDMADRLAVVRKAQEEILKLPEVGSALSAATFSPLPPAPPRISGIGRVLIRDSKKVQREVYNKMLEKHRYEFVQNGYVSDDKQEEVWRISARVSAVADIDYGLFVNDIRQKVDPLLARVNAAKGAGSISATYTGLVPLVYKSQRTLLEGLLWGFGMDLALIVVVLTLTVRDLGAGLMLLLPAVFPGVIIFGLLGWSGVVVDVGTVMPPSVALGVTVDDVVHFLLWFRRGLKQGMTRREAVMLAYEDCARPMFQSWVVIGLGLSVFALSPFTPTQRFGFLMFSLLTVALAGNLLLLPALLASPLGALFCPLVQWRNHKARAAGKLPTTGHGTVEAAPARVPVGAGVAEEAEAVASGATTPHVLPLEPLGPESRLRTDRGKRIRKA